ncbi:MAG: class I SAM-dependent methyltransferase, partial [Holophaga sp.]|nr:class I SAM-dependent methyltransferase [Holophaga sp.]
SLEGPALAHLLNLPRGSSVLDLPCGWGRLQPALEEHGLRVIGGDLSALNLERHAREFPAPLARLDFRALPFRDACVEGVFCAYTSWGYFASDAENLTQLQEFSRVLKPKGVLLLDLTGHVFLKKASEPIENTWFPTRFGYRERVRWSPDQRRIWTDRILDGERFRHDIWVPTGDEVLNFLDQAGFELDQAWGGLDGRPWYPEADRWIYRAIKKGQ